ncbi:MAG: T9SS type A sorting domain-containing protein [Chitinophagaceae bacterium]
MKKYLLLLCLLPSLFAGAQIRRIGVLGSSTANGQGIPFDSSWVQRLKNYYRPLAVIDTLQKVAASTFDCYSGMPTGYVPPAGRNAPNTNYNITKLMSRVPAPTTVIISYPTTNYNTFSDQEILFCLDSIRRYANAYGAKVFISTTQPRDNFNDAGRARLNYLNTVIRNYFVDSTIDFFTVLNNPVNNKFKAEFVLTGDQVHPNSRGHDSLFRQVLRKNILGLDFNSVERVLIDIGQAATSTTLDASGKYWTNMTDTRKGIRVSNAVTITNKPSSVKLEVINPAGSLATDNTGVASGGAVGDVAEYPASATNDHALAIPSITNGKWRIYGLDPQRTYTIRFWGSSAASGYRFTQIKRSDESVWQEYLATSNRNYQAAATFAFKGVTEMSFDLRAKVSNIAGIISVIDIVSTLPSTKQTPVKQPPVANAGADATIRLPLDSIRLNGAASYSVDDSIKSYKWRLLTGPLSFSFNADTLVSPILSGLITGTYKIELKVTDSGGRSGSDTVLIQVLPKLTNLLPIANAGTDLMIRLPLDSILLNASASTDPDGTLTGYKWEQTGGPSVAGIRQPGSAATSVTQLIAGSYTFRLTVTDDSLATATDTIYLTVLSPYAPPVAIAGPDLVLTLPGTVTLLGSGTDDEGPVATYYWTKLTGPTAYSLSSVTVARPVVSGLTAGIYTFELLVTDIGGLTARDTMSLTVNAAPVLQSQRILIDAGLAASPTASPTGAGVYWNNMPDARKGLQVNNAVSTTNSPTTIKLEVVNPTGTAALYDLGTRTSNAVGPVGDYPATATTDNAFIHNSITNGMWRIYGLDPSVTYTIKFWGTFSTSGTRIAQIKKTEETVWKEYNASLNTNFNTAASFSVTGKTEQSFNIRVKSGSTFSYINVIDITANLSSLTGKISTTDEETNVVAVSGVKSVTGESAANAKQDTYSKTASAETITPDEMRGPAVYSLAPNPAGTNTILRIDNNYRGTLELVLLNAYGQRIGQWRITKQGRTFTQTIDLARHTPGMYYLQVKTGTKTETLKLVKH